MSAFLQRLARGVVLFDGATGTQYQAAGLEAVDFTLRSGLGDAQVEKAFERLGAAHLDGCNELLSFSRPDVIERVHNAYLEAGSDVIETNTFGCTSIVLAEYDCPELDYTLSRRAAEIARKCADKFSTPEKPRFVAGGLGPGTKLISLGQATWEELHQTYYRATLGLIQGGVDVILLETLQDLLMVKAALVAVNDVQYETGTSIPIIVQVTMEQTGTMLVGSEMGAVLNMVECFPEVIAVGMNCATGPVEMVPHIRFLSQNSTRPLSIQPNAGLPMMEQGQAVYKLSPDEFAEHHFRFVEEFGVALCGGCCGTTPAHISALSNRIGAHAHTADCHWRKVQSHFPGFDFKCRGPEQDAALSLVGCSSLYQFTPYAQDSSYLIVGEKTNANGSKQFREMLAADNWDGLVDLARELEGEGSHVLDVCTAFVGRDEVFDMTNLLKLYNKQVSVPLMIDSTEAAVIEAGLKCLAGKPLINSINFEDGVDRTNRVLELCMRYGAAVVALTIDEKGMAKTAEEKVAIAERILERSRYWGLPDHDVFIDCLTFTLGSGDEEFRKSAMETIKAIAEVRKRHPRVNTLLGLSNVSFGLKPAARVVLNSAMLHYCREAGLTAAIVHFSKLLPENRIDAETWQIASDLIYDRRSFATV